MCGVAGIWEPKAPVDDAALRRMSDALAHRGPDGGDYHTEPGIGLAHRRLAIIDVAGGVQPMLNEDGTVAVVFNGMIYNFRHLRAELEALGHVFRTRCDTEVVVHGWESWGTGLPERLKGFFALAVWDRGERTLFLARDRLGKKPLYYARTRSGGVAFASEMAALREVPGVSARVDPRAMDDFFALGYVPDPGTIHPGVFRLPAGHHALLSPGRVEVMPVRYWRAPSDVRAIDEAEAVRELTARLEEAVRIRLTADVPLGAFLSGGVDSSAVVALAARMTDTRLATFTIGFEGREDETPWAAAMAERYGLDHHVERGSLDDPVDAARLQGRIFGEPFGDSSAAPTRRVCALARRHVTVALSGDGGDELFGGYRRHRWHVLTEGVRRWVPPGVRRTVLGGLAAAYPKLDRAPRFLRAKHTLTEVSLDSALGYYRTMAHTHEAARRRLFAPGVAAGLAGYDPGARVAALMDECDSDDPLIQAQYVDLHTYLVGDILPKVDRTAMSVGLEPRAPLLDHTLVEWAMRLPSSLKLRGGTGKWLLKKAMEPFVPHEILYRPKQGFATSHAGAFRREAGRVRARLLGPVMLGSGLFSADAVARVVDEHEGGAFDHAGLLWDLLVFEGFLAGTDAGSLAVAA